MIQTWNLHELTSLYKPQKIVEEHCFKKEPTELSVIPHIHVLGTHVYTYM